MLKIQMRPAEHSAEAVQDHSPHEIHRRLQPREQTELLRRLAHKHLQPTDRHAASSLRFLPQPVGELGRLNASGLALRRTCSIG